MRFLTPVLFTLLLCSCSDTPTGPEPTGTILVSVGASGGDLDNDFQVVVGNSSPRDVLANTTVSIETAAATQRVELQGVAANCEVTGQNPRTVAVRADKPVEITFDVVCATTGIQVRTRTHGFVEHSGYQVVLAGRGRNLGANDSLLINPLQPGSYSVAINLPGSYCALAGTPQFQVTVANRTVTTVMFEITCIPPARTEKIAYVTLGEVAKISFVNPDGSAAFAFADGDTPDWSPDGSKLAYSTLECYWSNPCSGGIVVADPEAQHFTQLSNGKSGYGPTWAPTGDMLAFIEFSSSGSSLPAALKMIRLDGSPSVNIPLPIVKWIGDLDWSPDGRRIAFTCGFAGVEADICVVNTDGSGFDRLTSGTDSESHPAWSPDGTRIAFNTWPAGTDTRRSSVAVMAADGSGVRQITSGARPAWSPDGTRLVFETRELPYRGVLTGLFTIRLDGSDLKRLTNGQHTSPAWRP